MQALLSKKFEEHRPRLEARDNTTTYAELQHAASVVSGKAARSMVLKCQSCASTKVVSDGRGEKCGGRACKASLSNDAAMVQLT
jgi:hypothetical protein